MRSILRTLPIRWQITLLHATILAVVLAVGGLAVWNAQRAFQYDSVIARQLTELRALIPTAPDRKLEAGIQLFQKTDPETLKARYAKIATAILPPGKDPAVVRKRLALLNPRWPTRSSRPARRCPRATRWKRLCRSWCSSCFRPTTIPKIRTRSLCPSIPSLRPISSPRHPRTRLQSKSI